MSEQEEESPLVAIATDRIAAWKRHVKDCEDFNRLRRILIMALIFVALLIAILGQL